MPNAVFDHFNVQFTTENIGTLMSEIITTETTNEVNIKADKASDIKTAVWRDYYE